MRGGAQCPGALRRGKAGPLCGARHEDKKKPPRRGRLPIDMRLVVGLEEDDAADLEQIPIVEALANMGLANRGVVDETEDVAIDILLEAGEGDVGRLVLPAGEHMHGGGVDLLHHAKTPALHLGPRDEYFV